MFNEFSKNDRNFESNLGTLFRSAQAFEAVTGSIIMYDRSMK